MSLAEDIRGAIVANPGNAERLDRMAAVFRERNRTTLAVRRDSKGYVLLWGVPGKGIRTLSIPCGDVENSDVPLAAWQVCEIFRIVRDAAVSGELPASEFAMTFRNLEFPNFR